MKHDKMYLLTLSTLQTWRGNWRCSYTIDKDAPCCGQNCVPQIHMLKSETSSAPVSDWGSLLKEFIQLNMAVRVSFVLTSWGNSHTKCEREGHKETQEKTVICKSRREASEKTTSLTFSLDFSLWNHEKINFCCLIALVLSYSILSYCCYVLS